jgi:N-acetylglucosamine-6-sulfatase
VGASPTGPDPSLRAVVAIVLAVSALAVAAVQPASALPPDPRLNMVVIVTDDQSPDSFPHDPPIMPKLQGMVEDPDDHWVSFSRAFVSTPLCCPSRASILTGRYDVHTGVRTNFDGDLLDPAATVAAWLREAGYRTGLVGKYLNGYPFDRSPLVPYGWDRWLAKEQGAQSSAYHDYVLIDQGFPVAYGDGPQDYLTDVVAGAAVEFILDAPSDRPFFLMLTPTAPHRPWTPAPRHAGAYDQIAHQGSPSIGEVDVSDKPRWVQALPQPTRVRRAQLSDIRRRSFESLLAVDDLVAAVIAALTDRGLLDRTVVFFMTDNGFSFGEHRWMGKTCPYEECIGTPLLVRMPGAQAREDLHLVSNVDLAPTIAELTGIAPSGPMDGLSLVPLLEGTAVDWRNAVFLDYVGDAQVPGWAGLRTDDHLYIEYVTGERELYDLTGTLGAADPFQLDNRVADPAYVLLVAQLSAELRRLRPDG